MTYSVPTPSTAGVDMLPPGGTYRQRCDALIDFYANRGPTGYLDYTELIEVAARLYRNRPMEEVLPILDPLLDDPRGDMFWMYPMVVVSYLGRDRLPEDRLRRIRNLWRTFTPYRGDTENHWAMYYSSLYLLAQHYPDDPPESWFNGRSSRENRSEAEEYLDQWIGLTTSEGQGEYDSPHYMPFFVTPMAMLYAFAEAPEMRQRAYMMLEYLLADFAVDTLDGLYAGAFSRIYPEPTLERWRNGSTTFAWLLFGNTPFRPDDVNIILRMPGYRPHGVATILAMSGYEPSKYVVRAATDRSRPYVHRERKRTRHRIRHSARRNVPVYKYVYMTRDFALGSTQGGLLQPVQQHTWELLWRTDDPHEGFNVLFTVHPYSSPHELAMYFPEEPQLMTDAVLRGKKETYDSPDKLTGGSPFEHVFQHRKALIALYNIPQGTRYPHLSGYFPPTLQEFEEDESGWIFCRGGDCRIAYYPLAPYEWADVPQGGRRLHSAFGKNGVVVHVASVEDHVDAAAFRDAVRVLPLDVRLDVPAVSFEMLDGSRIEHRYGMTPRIDGQPVDLDAWPLFEGPFLYSERGSRRLELCSETHRRIMDFDRFTVTDHPLTDKPLSTR